MTKDIVQKAVIARINGNPQHGWGVEDSLEVILAIVADEQGCTVKDLREASPGLVNGIKSMINPSQVRQSLETAKLLAKSEGGKRSGTLKSMMEGIASATMP